MDPKEKMLEEIRNDCRRFSEANGYRDAAHIDPEQFTEDLINKINQYQALLTPETEEHVQACMLKEYAILELANWNRSHPRKNSSAKIDRDTKRIEKILIRADPIKLKKNGLMLYISALLALSHQNLCLKNYENSRKYAKKADTVYQVYRSKNSEIPFDKTDFIGIPFDQAAFDRVRYRIAYTIWRSYDEDKKDIDPSSYINISELPQEVRDGNHMIYCETPPVTDPCPVKYVARGIKWLLCLGSAEQEGTDAIDTQVSALTTIYDMIVNLIMRHCFKQVDNVLAVVWSTSVKWRREQDAADRHRFNNAQALIGQLYARWASCLWDVSIAKYIPLCTAMIEHYPDVEIDNDSFEDISDLGDEEYKKYIGQFPIETVQDEQAIKRLTQKGKAWLDRAVDMSSNQNDFAHLGILYQCQENADEDIPVSGMDMKKTYMYIASSKHLTALYRNF